jgi:Domain of unknown function (DUF1707)
MNNSDLRDGLVRAPELRASDGEREATADRLRTSHSEGRLDSDEFAARIDRCYDAKTIRELDRLVADLPSDRELAPRGHGFDRRLLMLALVPLVVGMVAIIAAGSHAGFGFLIPLLVLGRVMFGHRRGPGQWHGEQAL